LEQALARRSHLEEQIRLLLPGRRDLRPALLA
jgi:hypothetical protein